MFAHLNVEAFADDRFKISAAPEHDFVRLDVWTFLNQCVEFLKLILIEL